LTVVGATDLERDLLQAARRERPSPELTKRMAAGLGISAAVATTVAAAPVAAAKTTLGIWLSAGLVAAAFTAGVVGVRLARSPRDGARKRTDAPALAPAPAGADERAAPAADRTVAAPALAPAGERRAERLRRRAPAALPASDLRDQIALVDAARGAVRAGANDRALALLRRYDASYPDGAFRPEALALRVEALDGAGHALEARALAREFLARYPQSPVADRVARVAQK